MAEASPHNIGSLEKIATAGRNINILGAVALGGAAIVIPGAAIVLGGWAVLTGVQAVGFDMWRQHESDKK